MLVMILAGTTFSAMALAAEPQTQENAEAKKDCPIHISPFSEIGTNALAIFSGSNGLIHLSAIGGTFLIVESGLDTGVHNFFVRNTFFDHLSGFGVSSGFFMPVALGGGLFCSGFLGKSSGLLAAGSAVLQSSLFALCYTDALKALTGRVPPEPVIYADNSASSNFRFGFLRGGVFWGWPSGHMMVNTAAVTSLLYFYKDKTLLNIAGCAYLGYLFLSVAAHHQNSMHWFSEEVAGTMMGFAIGSTVGRNFRRLHEKKKQRAVEWNFQVNPQLFAINVSIKL